MHPLLINNRFWSVRTLQVWIPIAGFLTVLALPYTLGDVFFEDRWPIWAMLITVFGGALSCFKAYFDDEVHNLLAWPGIIASGLAIIVSFAFVYAQNCASSSLCAHMSCIAFAGAEAERPDGKFTPEVFAYFSTVTFTTLGYGHFQPTAQTRSFAALQALLGYVYLGLLVGAGVHWGSQRN